MLNAIFCSAVLYFGVVSTSTQTTDETTVSDAEMRAIQEALGQDQSNTTPKSEGTSQVPPTQITPTQSPPTAAPWGRVLQSMNPDMALILDVAGAHFSDEPLQSGAHDPNRTGFTFQQLELNLNANVDPYFRIDTNIVFAQFGVEVEEAYASTLQLPGRLKFRAGQFLTRFGRSNSTHPHTWHFADQNLVLGKFFGGEGNRGLGFETSWLAPLPWYVEVVASGNDAAGECCARSYFGGDDLGVRSFNDFMYTLALKQFFPFDESWSLNWGLSGQFGPNASGNNNRTEIYGTDLYLRYRPVDSATREAVSLHVESLFRTRQQPSRLLQDFGSFAQLVWNFDLRWETGLRYEYVSGIENDPLDPQWTQKRQRLSAQLTFYPSHFSRIRIQTNYDRPDDREEPIWAGILNLEVLAGAHGAHGF